MATPHPAGTAVGPANPYGDQLRLRDQMRAVQREIRNKSWGKDLPDSSLKAIVLWCEKRGIDAATEVSVLGGNIYIEADYYLRKLAQMIGQDRLEYARPDHVHRDKRLEEVANDEKCPPDLREEAKRETYRRTLERAKHNLPDAAAAAVIYRIKVKGMAEEITGAKAVGNGVKKNDPVGDAAPMETAESRAARRACRQVIDTFPDLKAEMDVIEAEAKLVSIEVKQGREQVKREMAQPSMLTGGAVRDSGYDDPAPARTPEEEDRELDRQLVEREGRE